VCQREGPLIVPFLMLILLFLEALDGHRANIFTVDGMASIRPSLRDLILSPCGPGIEMPGYFRIVSPRRGGATQFQPIRSLSEPQPSIPPNDAAFVLFLQPGHEGFEIFHHGARG